MKTPRYTLLFLLAVLSCSSPKEKVQTPSIPAGPVPETFSYQDNGTTYVMQKYFLVLLKKGPNRTQSKEDTEEIQKKHMEHLSWLHQNGKISLAGPMDKHETISGILVFNTPTLREADSLAKLDPAVKSGRLEVETMGWWAAKGSKLE